MMSFYQILCELWFNFLIKEKRMDISTLLRLADPVAKAKAAVAGLPTIDTDAFKKAVTAHLDVKNTQALSLSPTQH